MKNTVLFCMLVCALVLGGCAPIALPTGSTATATELPNRSVPIRVGFSTITDMGDIPSLMAHELLTAQGYTIQVTPFAGADLQVAALMQGELDIGNGSLRTMWLAFGKAPMAITIMEQVSNDWILVAKPEYKTCGDLEGKRIAFTNNSSLNRALFDAHTQEHCPDLKFAQLFISSSANRAAALLAGELEATPLNTSDWIQVQQKAPNRFHALVIYRQQLPNLKTTGVHANRAFAERQPEAVRDYVRALLTVHRMIKDNPEALRQAIIKHLGFDPATAQTIAQTYLELDMWDANGGLTREDVQYSIDFFSKTNSIPDGLTADGVADLSYLNAALEEMGRK